MKSVLIAFILFVVSTGITNGAPNFNKLVKRSQKNSNNDGRYIPQPNIDFKHLRLLKSQMRILGHYLVKNEKLSQDGREALTIDLSCVGCTMAVGTLQFFIELGLPDNALTSQMKNVCSLLKIGDEEVCTGIINLFGAEVMYLLRNVDVSADETCSFILEGTCPDKYTPRHQWDVVIPPELPANPIHNPIPNDNAPRLKVLHLSDHHYDPYYAEGMNANCEHPLCCRASNGRPSHAYDKAGKWGHYGKCDTPKRTIDHLLDHIGKDHPDIDYILWTGDLPPHDVWNQTRSSNLEIIKETAKQLTEKFPNIPIFPALGNHESAPVNTFPPHYLNPKKISSSWLYDELDVIWKKWLPANVSETVRRGAFYSIQLKSDLRIISLNMNYCNNKNLWLLVNTTDPDEELEWLIEELEGAEKRNEKVHIVGHIPPGNDDCLKVWSRNFYKIIARFENTIMAQFYGHTHYDELEIFYDPDNLDRPTNIAYIGPSVTPFINLNPGYRIYYVDGDHKESTRMVVDHETWVMNLEKANLDDNPIWYKLYSAKSAYNMTGLSPKDWNDLIKIMEGNSELFELYYKFYWKDSPKRPACDQVCKRYLLCNAKCGRSHDRKSFCSTGRKIGTPLQRNSWTNSIDIKPNSALNLLNSFKRSVQIATNEVDPFNIYDEL